MLDTLHQQKRFKRCRESSYERTGRGADFVKIAPGQGFSVAPLTGPGIIRHIWLALGHFKQVDAYRVTRLVIQFDGAPEPQVDVPLADFFLFGHGGLVDVDSIPIQVWHASRNDDTPPFLGALNCTFPMPFSQSAEISLVNTSDGPRPFNLHYYVDWEQHDHLDEPVLHFRATFNEEVTEPPEGRELAVHGKGDPQLQNLSDAENYRFLDVDGLQGHYVGTGLSLECEPDAPGKWWEGDDMFILDGEPWPPRLHGTGHEDYFNVAYGFHRVGCRPEYGVPYIEKTDRDTHMIDGKFSMYRFHVSDPIPFEKSIVASIEHGHANDCRAHYRSVAYWYGKKVV